MKKPVIATLFAILAAVLYAISMPASKVLLGSVSPTMMAAFLYLGAGIGIGFMLLISKDARQGERLEKADLPYTIGMVVLDIAAPILLMLGLRLTSSANAALLNNFEIVATAIIALAVFKEQISKTLWVALRFITLSSMLLSFEGLTGFHFSWGSLLVLAAAICWGLENNFTRKISHKNTYQIVTIKGLFSGAGALLIALLTGNTFPRPATVAIVLLLGFVAYGLSIFFYIKAQSVIGAAKTSAWYAIAPFVGALLSFLFLNEAIGLQYIIALVLMLLGSTLVILDTMTKTHTHEHSHAFDESNECNGREEGYTHNHQHKHFWTDSKHDHKHP